MIASGDAPVRTDPWGGQPAAALVNSSPIHSSPTDLGRYPDAMRFSSNGYFFFFLAAFVAFAFLAFLAMLPSVIPKGG
jgi:hypothetical protein